MYIRNYLVEQDFSSRLLLNVAKAEQSPVSLCVPPPLGLQKLDSENSSQVIVPSCSILLILLKSVVGVRKSRTSTYWYGFIWYPFHVYWTGYWSVVIMFALRQCVVYVYMFHSDICRILLYRVSLSPSIPGSSVDLSILKLGINTCH